MGTPKPEVLLVDANVLIDFCRTDQSVVTLVSTHVAIVNVAEPVLEEVDQLDRMTAESLGLRVVTPDFACLSQAASLAHRSPLQFQDWVCLLLAESKRWTCVTNDKRLRAECTSRSVSILWGLELLIRLVEEQAFPAPAAIQLVEDIHKMNPRIPRRVVNAFVAKVRKSGG